MNQVFQKIFPIAVLFLLILAPFAGLAPVMLLLLGLLVYWTLLTILQAFFTNPNTDEARE